MADAVYFPDAAAWREWLARHHDTAADCLVGFIKATTGNANMSWSESVDEALCFGWIDGVRRRVDDERYTIRFTPRKPTSNWSKINIAKVERLRAAGRMTPAGEAAFADRRADRSGIYSFERDAPAELSAEQRDGFSPAAWEFFTAQAPGYQRTATHWVVSAKREETCAKRLAQLVADSAEGRRIRQLDRDRRQ